MSDDLDIVGELARIWDQISRGPQIKEGKVVQVSPLLVQLNGDIDPAGDPVPCPATAYVSGLVVGSRVLCVEQNRRVLAIAKGVS